MTPPERALAVEREALGLLPDLLDLTDPEREARLSDPALGDAVRLRLAAMLEADRRASLRTGAAADDADAHGPAPERIGAYRVTGLVGRGGMGAVWRAERDTGDFTRTVAIKLIKPGLLSEELVDRFRAERQTLAGLAHPNIARLYDGGESEDGAPYIVMELVDGAPIDRWADARALGPDARLMLVETTARAVAHAHARLVVHRDITPANVLVTEAGEVKLIDFGIARPSDGAAPATTAVDIEGLGRLLARLLPRPDPEVAAIIARATDPDPTRRYATAQGLANDIAAKRRGDVVLAHPGGWTYRAGKFVRRHRVAVAAASLAVVALVGGLVATLAANAEARRAQAEAVARFEQTRGIAKAMLFDVFDAVSRVPGATRARQVLASTSADYLDALAALPAAGDDVRAEAARGFVRLAAVTGGGQSASLGRYEDADALLARAAALIEPAFARTPRSQPIAEAFATLRLEQAGTNLYNNNDSRTARAQAIEAERAAAPFALEGDEAARLTAVAIQTQGDAFGWEDRQPQAIAEHERAEAFSLGLPPAIRESDAIRSARSANLRLLAEAYHRAERPGDAARAIEAAVALNRALVAGGDGRPEYARKLALSLWWASIVHGAAGDQARARRDIGEAVTLARGLVARDPEDKGALQPLALLTEVAAQTAARTGERMAMAAFEQESLAAHARLLALAGNAPGALRSMTVTRRSFGRNRFELGDIAGACAMWRPALAGYRTLERRGALSDFDRRNGLPEVAGYVRDICDGGLPRSQWALTR